MSTPLDPDESARQAGVEIWINGGNIDDVAEAAVEAYLAVAYPTLNTVNELYALPGGSVVLDADRFPYRQVPEYEDHGPYWEGIDCGDPLDVSTLKFPATVIYRGADPDA